jgi:hypothetical protein
VDTQPDGHTVENLRPEPRWPVAVSILFLLIILAVLPDRFQALPPWVPFVIAAIGWASMLAVALATEKRLWLRIEGAILKAIAIWIIIAAVASIAILIDEIVKGPGASGLELLTSSVAIWAANVIAFSLLYWQIDGDGPVHHLEGRAGLPDWLFAQPATSESAPSGPVYVDYLFLAFSTATAFSTTDTIPLTPKAKLLMMLEAVLSLSTLAVVASRAINILGT